MNQPVEAHLMSHLMNNYSRQPVAFTHGVGAWLYGTDGNRYLDALSGVAVNGLGHAHPKFVKALQDQVAKLIHVSNIYEVAEQAKLPDISASLSASFACSATS